MRGRRITGVLALAMLALWADAGLSGAAAQIAYPPVDTAPIWAAIPQPASSAPPSVADASATGTQTSFYALANHTHASKARKGRVQVPASGTLAVSFAPAFGATPVCAVTAEATAGDTNVVNAQIDGTPSASGMTIRITRTQQSVVSLIGLTVLSVPTQVATWAHYVCIEA